MPPKSQKRIEPSLSSSENQENGGHSKYQKTNSHESAANSEDPKQVVIETLPLYTEYLEEYEKQKDEILLAIDTSLRMKIESAHRLADYERLQAHALYEESKSNLLKQTTESSVEEPPSPEEHDPITYVLPRNQIVDYDFGYRNGTMSDLPPVLRAPLTEEEMSEDFLIISSEWNSICRLYSIKEDTQLIVSLSEDLLYYVDRVVTTTAKCQLKRKNRTSIGCIFKYVLKGTDRITLNFSQVAGEANEILRSYPLQLFRSKQYELIIL